MARTLLCAWALVLSPFAVAAAQDDLPGAYYYKETVASTAHGIRGEGVLPSTVKADPARVTTMIATAADEWKRGSQDAPAYYLGGTGPHGQEVEAGLAWMRVENAKGDLLWTDDASGSDRGIEASQFVLKAGAGGVTATVGDDATVWKVVDAATNKAVRDLNALEGIKVNLVNGAATVGRANLSLVPDKAFRPFARVAGVLQSDLTAANPTFHLSPGQGFQMSASIGEAGQVHLNIAGLDATGALSPNGFASSFKASEFVPGANITWSRVSALTLGGAERMAKDEFAKLTTATRALDMQWLSGNLLQAGGKLLPFEPTKVFSGGLKSMSVARLAAGGLRINMNPLGSLFKGELAWDIWIVKMFAKSFNTLCGGNLGATAPGSIFFSFAIQFPPKIHFGGAGPAGALVFFPTKLGVSNGDGTVFVRDNPAASARGALAWVEAPKR